MTLPTETAPAVHVIGVEDVTVQPAVIRWAMAFILSVLLVGLVWGVGHFWLVHDWTAGVAIVESTLANKLFWSAIAVGFLAQAIDGALGMAYGITSTTFLMTAGASPAMASASVHIAEVFTTGASGVAHARLGNVERRLFLRLLAPGILGCVLGAIVVTQVDASIMAPFVSVYLLFMGGYVLSKAWRERRQRQGAPRHLAKLALFGGFVDGAGGGGWGPVVATSLIGSGSEPRSTIGSVNFAEFFIALAGAASFSLMVASGVWVLVVGLVIGGLFAAPFAALVARRLKARTLLVLVGLLISAVSSFNLYRALI